MKKKDWFRALFTSRIMISLLVLFQIAALVFILYRGSRESFVFQIALTVLSMLVSLGILSTPTKGSFKLTWIFLILLLPVLGGLFYMLFSFQLSTSRMRKVKDAVEEATRDHFVFGSDVSEEIEEKFPRNVQGFRYLQNNLGFCAYKNTLGEYLSPGEKMYDALIEELKKAEKYIFLEYFIIDEGKMWNTVLDILIEKAKQGLDVRLIYDDVGCFLFLPQDYPKRLAEYGIKCTIFKPFAAVLTATQNHRDHRKIVAIDGKVAFTGGANLADEYINERVKYGHWKDASIMLKGDAAWSLTLMFLRMWALCNGGLKDDIESFKPERTIVCDDGYYQPYSDNPLDTEHVSEHFYLHMINVAQEYLYINTPYLILDDTMASALTLAAKSGVDVRICTPHIWDKHMVHLTTRSYYKELIEGGIRIYEYTKGFIHAKTVVSDDITASVGTANFDFRSLYLSFEDGVRIYGGKTVTQIKQDFLENLETCQEITLADCKANLFKRIFQNILRLFAPLM